MEDTNWLTVDQATVHCQKNSLNRSKKTMRRWAQHGEVEAKKQTMQKGMRWLISQSSLETKIQEELEFQKQQQTSSEQGVPMSRQSSDVSAHERPQADMTSHRRSQPNGERPQADTDAQEKIRSLESKVMELTIDVRWRSQALDQLKSENERLLENLHGHARYIGHLEADLMQLGGQPDQQFLAAPKVKTSEGVEEATAKRPNTAPANRPNPDQQHFMTG